jgi:hypothetical protein
MIPFAISEMKTTVVILGIVFFALSCRASTNQIAATPDQHEEMLEVRELDQLISTIHLDLLKLKDDHIWLSGYATNCLWEGRSIFFMPPLRNEGGLQPQQPDQLYVGYIPIGQRKGFKYDNDLEETSACRFPLLKAKIYAHILVRGKDNAKTAEAIRECIIKRCDALHMEMAH